MAASFFGPPEFITAQTTPQLYFKRYNLHDGIPQSTITCLHEDRNGFIWLGTWGAVCRWDGQQFINVTNYDGEPALPTEMVRSIKEDSSGNIWVGTRGGLIKVDPITCKGRSIPVKGIKNSEWFIYHVWPDSILMLATYQGFGILHLNDHSFKLINNTCGTNFYPLIDFNYSSDTTLLTGSDKGSIYILSAPNETIKRVTLPMPLQKVMLQSIVKSPLPNCIYLATGQGVYQYNLKDNQIQEIPIPDGLLEKHRAYNYQYLYMAADAQNIWAVNYNGAIGQFDLNFTLRDYFPATTYKYKNQSFTIDPVQNILLAKNGMLWVATDGNGLCYYNPQWPQFNKISLDNIPNLKQNIYVRNIETLDNLLFVNCSNAGVLVFDHQVPDTKNPTFKTILKNAGISSLRCIKNNEILIGSTQNILLYNNDLQCQSTLKIDHLVDYSGIKFIDRLNDSLFMAFTSSELIVFNLNGFQQRLWVGEGIYCGKVIADNEFLLSLYNSGIKCYKYNGRDLTITDSLKFNGNFSAIPLKVRSFSCDKNKDYWFGSGNILVKADSNLNVIDEIGTKDGLRDAIIFLVQADSSNHIWIGSSQGLACFWPQTRQVVHYSVDDGLQSDEFNSGASLLISKNLLFMGGINGFNYFNPDAVTQNSHPAKPFLTELITGNIAENVRTIDPEKPLVLDFEQNSIEFKIIPVELSNPERNKLLVKLEGADTKWNNASYSHPVRYAGLKPGKYTLWAKGANCDGLWSDDEKMFSIVIKPPFYKTAWFIGFNILVLISGLVFISVYLVKRKARQRIMALEIEKQMLEIRYRISSDIHDDIGAGLTRISLLSQLVHKESAKLLKDDSLQRIDKLGQTARQLISSLNELIWVVNPENDTLGNLMARIRNYAYEFFEDSEMRVEINFPDTFPDVKVRSDFRRHYLFIVKEALNNAMKYSCASVVKMQLSFEGHQFRFTISDNGIGFDLQNAKAGNGLRTMQKNAALVGADLQCESGKNKGTSITITGNIR